MQVGTSLIGNLSGLAGGYFSTVATGAVDALHAGSITANGGSITLTATNQAILTQANSLLAAYNSVSFSGSTGVTTASGTTATAGKLPAADSVSSTNLSDYSVSNFISKGGINITSSSGAVTVGTNNTLQAIGSDVAITSAGSTNVGSGANFIAQGGNILVNAGSNASFAGGSILSVARTNASQPPLYIAQQYVPYFTGGGIAIWSGSPATNLGTQLQNDTSNRSFNGTEPVAPAPSGTYTGSTINAPANGGTISMQVHNGGTISFTNSKASVNGGVIDIDPPTNISINNLTLVAVQPAILPVLAITGPPVAPTSSTLSPQTTSQPIDLFSSTLLGSGATLFPPSGTIVGVDSNRQITSPTIQAAILRNCVPAPIAAYVEGQSAQTWSVATGYCQSFSFRDKDGSAVVSQGGTAIAPSGDHSLKIKEGKMFAMSGSNGMRIETDQGIVSLPPDSSALIEQRGSGVVRIAFVTGEPATFNFKGIANKLDAAPGSELIVAPSTVEDEELIPTDGVERVEVDAKITIATAIVHVNNIDRKSLVEKDKLLNCSGGCFPQYIRSRLDKLKASVDKPSPISLNNSRQTFASNPINHLRPVGYQQATQPSAANTLDTLNATLKYFPTTKFTAEHAGQIKLTSGDMVVSAIKPLVVITTQGQLNLPEGTIAAISSDGKILRIRTLWEQKTNSANFISSGHLIQAGAGQELIVATNEHTMHTLQQSDTIARRMIRMSTLPDGKAIMMSEVSFVSLIAQSKLLSNMLNSADDSDRAISNKLQKMAVALSLVTGRHGAFSPLHPAR